MGISRTLIVLLAAALAPSAQATTLYKSISPTGVIQFSDTPPDEHSQLIEQRDLSQQPSSSIEITPARMAPMETLVADEVVARATEKVDLAEHALALARRGTWSPVEGLHLKRPARTTADEQRIEYYKHNVLLARQSLLETLKERSAAIVSGGSSTVVATR